MKRLLSIDPGHRAGWALWEYDNYEGTLVDCGKARTGAHGAMTVVKCATPPAKFYLLEQGCNVINCTLVAEDQYFTGEKKNVGENQKGKKKRGLKLSNHTIAQTVANRARFETVAELEGWTVAAPVQASIWQKAVLGLGPRASRSMRKRKAQEIAKHYFDVKVNQDVADAVCIGAYWLGRAWVLKGKLHSRRLVSRIEK